MLQRFFIGISGAKSRIWIGISAAACVVGVLGVGVYLWRSHLQDSSVAQSAPLSAPTIATVTALGRLEPQGEVIHLSAPISCPTCFGNRVGQLLVKEGDQVRVGQIVAILDSRDRLQAAYEQSQEEVRVAEAKLAITRAGAKQGEINAQRAEIAFLEAQRRGEIEAQEATVARLKAELNNAETELIRYERLAKEGVISTSYLDNKRLILTMANQSVQEAKAVLARIQSTTPVKLIQAKANLDRIAEVRPVDIEASQAEVNRAKAAMKQAKVNLDQSYVRSPIAGEILEIHTRVGEVISTNGIMDIGNTKRMYIVAQVYESDIQRVKLGQQAKSTSDSISGELIGTVERIDSEVKRQNLVNTDPSTNVDGRVVEVHIALDPDSSQRAAKFTNLQVTAVIEE
uniref:ABC exporter membrane fusion protein, DevB family n=1 Tax=Cyanothece sp. (strain PCC 7425 / ATCC 29141) TaxID=395961 RepID=B8HL01_CYAP4